MTKRNNALSWLLLSALVIALDQLTKHLALAHLQPYEAREVLPGLLNWTLAFNPGAAFSFLAGADGWQRWFFTVLAVGVSAGLAFWLSRLPRGDWRNAAPLALIIGGADGIDPLFKQTADEAIRLSDMTLPHALARVLLLEQLYRAWSLQHNHPYHRA